MPVAHQTIGHEVQRAELEQDLTSENVAHAYLFVGPPHVGKTVVALWFAQRLLTVGQSEEQAAIARSQIERLIHPDLLILDQLWIEGVCEEWDVIARFSNAPQEHRSKKSTPAKTDTISIDDVRALQQRLQETGTGRFRCCIITDLERMQDAAANALLKILEEPPGGLVFILTSSSGSLLPTITSRTRVMQFHRAAPQAMLPLLTVMNDDDTQFILQVAQGAPGWAIHLRDNPDALRSERQHASLALRFWDATSLHDRLGVLGALSERGEAEQRFLMHLGLALRRQSDGLRQHAMPAYLQLLRDLEQNVHRGLSIQRFALAVGMEDMVVKL